MWGVGTSQKAGFRFGKCLLLVLSGFSGCSSCGRENAVSLQMWAKLRSSVFLCDIELSLHHIFLVSFYLVPGDV